VTATVTTWHRVKVIGPNWAPSPNIWASACVADGCDWGSIAVGPGAWQSAVGKALAHVDETKEEM